MFGTMKKKDAITKIAILYLVIFCIHFLPIEGYVVAYVKFTAMAIAPILTLVYVPCFSRAACWCIIYYISVFFSLWMSQGLLRWSSIIFSGMYLVMYVFFYNLTYSGAFSIMTFIKVIRYLIISYTICLICQQICCLIGIHYMPIINLVNPNCSQISKLNSLHIEPSSAARTLGCLMFALIKTTEIRVGFPPSLRELYTLYKYEILGWTWTMLTMGSGTAFVCIIILSLYFLKKKYVIFVIIFLFMGIIVVPRMNIENINRELDVFEAVKSLDADTVKNADGSAAVRVLPIINTINNFDLSSYKFWWGQGLPEKGKINPYSSDNMIGCITTFGFLSYLFSLGIIFRCAIRRFISLPTLMHFIGVGGGVSNIAYGWGLLMIFTVLYYLEFNQINNHGVKS